MTMQKTPSQHHRSHPHQHVRRSLRKSKTIIAIICLVALALAATAAGCGPKAPAGGSATPGGTNGTAADPARPMLTSAASALDKHDAAAFAATLSTPLRDAIGQSLDISGSGAAGLAKALRDATLIASYETTRVYQTKVGEDTFSFLMVKEGDQWLIAEL
jgi:hypothetical protein